MIPEDAIELIFHELRKAEKKFPGFPADPIHGIAIMIEEAGEATKAALDMHYRNGLVADLRTELAQTAAMCIRCMIVN